MLSIKTLKGSGAGLGSYFEKEAGQADYWSKEAQESTQWHGKGAQDLGLSGAVDQKQFQELMDRKLPDGRQLPTSKRSRMGWDLTFSAPKSVSLQALVHGDERIVAAHQEAVKSALNHVEKNVISAQQKIDGQVHNIKTGNMTAAVFKHETSRELDPQLHSHAVVANMTKTPDGRMRGLQGREFFKAKMEAGATYRAELAGRLQKLGYKVEKTHADGRFELKGFDRKQLEKFSTRRMQVEKALKESGHTSSKAADVAALSSRKAKVAGLDKQQMRETWKARAKDAGIKFQRSAEKSQAPSKAASRKAADTAAWKAAEKSLRGGRKVTRSKLSARAIGHATGKADPAAVQRAVGRLEKSGLVKFKKGIAKPTLKFHARALGKQAGQVASRHLRAAVRRAVVPAPIRAIRNIGKMAEKEQDHGHGMSR